MFMYLSGSWVTQTQGSSSCAATNGPAGWVHLPTPYVYVEDPPVTRTDNAILPSPPTDIIEKAVSQDPGLLKEWPGLTDCELVSGTGQPTVHVPVTALTSHSSTTIRKAGPAPAPTTKSAVPPTQPAVPSETSQPNRPSDAPAEPSVAPQPVEPPPQVSSDVKTSSAIKETSGGGPTPQPSQPQQPQEPQQPQQSQQPTRPTRPTQSQQPPQESQVNSAPAEGGTPLHSETGSRPIESSVADGEPTLPFPILPAPAPTAPGSQDQTTSTPKPGAVVLPNDQTLQPGQVTTISGVAVSVPTPRPATPSASTKVTVVDGTTTLVVVEDTSASSEATPVVVVDGTTVTLSNPAPTSVPAVPITIGSQVVSIHAPASSESGVVLPNSEVLSVGATTTIVGQTLVATVVTSGTNVATGIVVVDESTTQTVILPTGGPTTASSKDTNESTKTDADLPEFTGGGTRLSCKLATWALLSTAVAGILVIM